MKYVLKTVNSDLDLPDIFMNNDSPLTLSDMTRSTDLSTTTLYRLASTLRQKSFLSYKEVTYSLGLKLMDYIYIIRRNIKFMIFPIYH